MPYPDELQLWLSSDTPDLVDAIISDIQQHVSQLHSQGISFYGYAALPGDYLVDWNPANLAVAYNMDANLSPDHKNDPYYRYCVDEWDNYVHDGFDKTNAVMSQHLTEFQSLHNPTNKGSKLDDFERAYIAKVDREVLKAMLELRRNGTFRQETFLVVWYSDSSSPVINLSAKTLNPPDVYEEYDSVLP
jgi:hypothetical protein